MKAQETALRPMFEGTKQYVVPLYQRRYAWRQEDWDTLWASLSRQYTLLEKGKDSSPTHFLGSLVVRPRHVAPHGVAEFDIIDGQQRLTSVYILLIALRDRWMGQEEKDRLHETFLVNKFKKGDSRYKLLSGPHDMPDIKALLNHSPNDTVGQVGQAYKEFNRKLDLMEARGALDLTLFETALLTRMEVVDITTDTGDNAHRIFQTLNSTGRTLSQVDLLRNHFFMLLPSRAEEAYADYWQPIENSLGDAVDSFFWSDLIARVKGAESTPRDQVYRRWSEILAESEDDEQRVVDTLADVRESARLFSHIKDPALVDVDAGIRDRLQRLKAWGAPVHYPLTLLILRAHADGALTSQQTRTALSYEESYLVRRMLLGIPTNNLNRLFTTTVGQVRGASDLSKAIHLALSGRGKYWPPDEELLDAIEERPFYLTQRGTQRQFVLQRLEERMSSEYPNWETGRYTIEHIMPQTLSPEWWEHLGEDTREEYETLIHSLGNLTLTTENSKLSNGIFQRKQDILQSSFLRMNQKLVETGDSWTYAEIRTRSRTLAKLAIEEWPAPASAEDVSEAFKDEVRTELATLHGDQWISIDDLAGFTQTSDDEIRAFLIAEQPPGSERVLSTTGSMDLDLPWVSNDVRAYKAKLVALGIFSDLDSTTASGERIDPND